ncbi:MAG TPA: hypothetical protein VKB47_11835 [Terracidiphilus sp.]|nr:hypothetical protein [Terracidiphilus sp.]
MPLDFAMSLMSVMEFALWATLGFFFWKKGLHKRFPALNVYLVLRVSATPVLLGLLYLQAQPWGHQYFPFYFYPSWAVYIASAIMLFFVVLEIFRSVLSAFSGLMRLGTVIFRWVALVAAVASLGTVSFAHLNVMLIPDIAWALMRSVSILELCLLAFLCLCFNALQLSVRDLTFGFGLGFGLMSANDFILSAFVPGNPSLTAPAQFAYEGVILITLTGLVAYCAMPERVRKPVVMPANSTIYRWNEIASALGHGTKVAVQQPANGFFLTDVERVVEKVLTRNLQGNESKS